MAVKNCVGVIQVLLQATKVFHFGKFHIILTSYLLSTRRTVGITVGTVDAYYAHFQEYSNFLKVIKMIFIDF